MKKETRNCSICNNLFESVYRNSRWVECCSRHCSSELRLSRIDKKSFGDSISTAIKKRIESGKEWKNHSTKHSEFTKQLIGEKARLRYSDPSNNPMFGRSHTKESRERMSKTRSKRMSLGFYVRSKGSREYFEKSGNIFCRSTWEKKVAEILQKDNRVISFQHEPISISYARKEGGREHLRWYTPDFLAEYSDGSKKIIEVKPECYVNADVNVQKFSAAREFCAANNMTFEVWTQKEILS